MYTTQFAQGAQNKALLKWLLMLGQILNFVSQVNTRQLGRRI